MKRIVLALVILGSAFACDDIETALEQRRAMADGGMGGGGGVLGGGSGGGTAGGGSTGGGTAGGPTGGGPTGGGGGTPEPTDGGLCLQGFCWENPLPQGNTLHAVWSNDDGGEVWVVGEKGMAFRWTARGWETFQDEFPRNEDLNSVWGAGNHLWVVGTRDTDLGGPTAMNPMHFDGSRWNEESWSGADPELLTVRGRDENEVWAAGLSGVLSRRDPSGSWTGWTFEPTIGQGNVALPALAFDSEGRCAVALRNDLNGVARCDAGAAELSLDASYEIAVNGLWSPQPGVFRAAITRTIMPGGSTAGELWLGSDAGWARDFTDPVADTCSAGVPRFAYCGSDVTAQGEPPMRVLANLPYGGRINGAWTPAGPSLEGSWMVGEAGLMHRYFGGQWRSMRRGVTETIFSLWVDDQRALAVGSSSVVFTRFADTSWSATQLTNGQGETRDLWISADGGYRAYVGVNRMLLEGLNPSSASQAPGVPPGPVGDHQLNGLWGLAPTDLWAVGTDGEIWHRTDAGWGLDDLDAGQLWDIDGTSPDNAFIVGAGCLVLHRDATADGGWVNVSPPSCSDELYGVWVPPANDAGLEVVAVSRGDAVFFRNGGTWSTSNPQAVGSLYKVWGTGPRDIWAVGDFGALVHFDGVAWTPIQTGTRSRLESVRGRTLDGGALELFVGGVNGAVLRRVVP